MTFLTNFSLRFGVFPSELKLARVVHVPILKAFDSSALTNYRLISVLTFFAKVFEKVINNKILDFISDHNVLYDQQYGFLKSRSTQHVIITLVVRITKSLHMGDLVIVILINLKKAFDTVDHKILLQKLYAYGIRGNMLKWFDSYLYHKTQYLVFDDEKADTHSIKCGVPQGSNLGSLLYILTANDIFNVPPLLFKILFTVETCVLLGSSLLHILCFHIELISLNNWFKANNLSINTTTYFIYDFSQV